MDPRKQIAVIAASQIGTSEDAAHSNRGAAILKYQEDTTLAGQGWPWCAAFVDWCVHQFLMQNPDATKISLEQRPGTPSAFGLRTWGNDHGCLVQRVDPQPGDIVVYTFSHTGIVECGAGERTSCFIAIEGNTNADGGRDGYEVARRMRNLASVLCFVRLPLA
jgi:hypothetical protein